MVKAIKILVNLNKMLDSYVATKIIENKHKTVLNLCAKSLSNIIILTIKCYSWIRVCRNIT